MNNRLLVLWIFVQQCFSQHLGKEECSSGCKSCFNGRCLTCRSSYYGLDCTSRCNDRCIQDGSCQGEVCYNGCLFQRYGPGCTRKCLHCDRGCHKNGICKKSPKTDYHDDFSKTKKSNKKLGAVLKAVAATVSITVITCVITACCRRKKESSDLDSDDFQDVVVDNYESSSDDSSLVATRTLGRETGYSSPARSPIGRPDYSSVAASSGECDRTSGHRLQPRSRVAGPENQSFAAFSEESNRRVPSPNWQLPHSGLEGPDYSSVASSVEEAQERRRANRHGLSSLDTTSATPSGDVINSSVSSGPPTAPPPPPPPPSYSSPPPEYSSGNSEAPPPSYSSLFPDRTQR